MGPPKSFCEDAVEQKLHRKHRLSFCVAPPDVSRAKTRIGSIGLSFCAGSLYIGIIANIHADKVNLTSTSCKNIRTTDLIAKVGRSNMHILAVEVTASAAVCYVQGQHLN